MFRLIEITKQSETEAQAIYPYEDYTTAKGEFETKLGANMKSDAFTAYTLMILDNTGKALDTAHEGESLSPRLIEVKVTDEEVPNISKYDTVELVEANFHSKWGSAIKNDAVRAIMLRGIDGFGGEVCYTYWIRPVEVDTTTTPEPEDDESIPEEIQEP